MFERSYNSRAGKDGPLGYGWTHSFNHSFTFSDGITSSVTWSDGSGAQRFIAVVGVTAGSAFTAPSGFFFQSARQGDGSYTLREKNGLTYTLTGSQGYKTQYSYDPHNNITQTTDAKGQMTTATWGTGHQLLSVKDAASGLGYDTLNRLTQVQKTGLPTQSYQYDDQGRRIGKTVGTTSTSYLYNGPDILGEYASWAIPPRPATCMAPTPTTR